MENKSFGNDSKLDKRTTKLIRLLQRSKLLGTMTTHLAAPYEQDLS